MQNVGPDGPFGGGSPNKDFNPADKNSTGQVMQFRVVGGQVSDPTAPPDFLDLPAITPLGAASNTQLLTLHEEVYAPADIPVAALLGQDGTAKLWSDDITENPHLGSTEMWEIKNLTEDAHSIHIHLVQFQVVGRGVDGTQGPEPWERGFKDTVITLPGEITRVKAKFDIPGLFVWHCHIVEHEDNEMMRPYRVGP